MTGTKPQHWLIPVCFAIIYLVWGSTYLANWYAIQGIPPFLMSGGRFFLAGLLLFGVSYIFGAGRPTAAQWKNTAFIGTLLLAVGTGSMVWSEQFINSGMVALMAAFQPLLIVLMMWQMYGKRPSLRTIAGTALGMIGMAFLVGQDQFISDKQSLIGIAVIFVAIMAWGFASIKVAKLAMPSSKLQGAAMQMLIGGSVLLVVSFASGEMTAFRPEDISSRAAWSWLYLVGFGSIVAFSAFNYLLVKSTPDKVATANYVNPVVAMLLGWGLNNEEITSQSLIAAVLLLTGVVFINTRVKLKRGRMNRPLPIASLITQDGQTTREVDIQPSSSDTNLIARIWLGKTSAENAQNYIDRARKTVVREFSETPGNKGLTFQHRTDGDVTHLVFISYWEDMKAIRNFAGKDYRKARLRNADKINLHFKLPLLPLFITLKTVIIST
jgi:drug/metabolite transporter (DMT)-like permease/heme-degrading monooxygenase HmoA